MAETYNNELRTFVEEHDDGLPSGCVGDIHYKSGFNEKVVSEFDDLKQPESSESESPSESQITSESSEVDEQTSENTQ